MKVRDKQINEKLQKKALVCIQMMQSIGEYITAFPPYMPFRYLAGQFNSTTRSIGGVKPLIDELEALGLIRVHLNEFNTRLIYLEPEKSVKRGKKNEAK